jgi:uncharacterized protein YyaL (SSP411 family)
LTGEFADPETTKFLHAIREAFNPNRVLILLDPKQPPRELAQYNGTLRALLDSGELSEEKPNVRVCENFTCGLPLYDPKDLKLS